MSSSTAAPAETLESTPPPAGRFSLLRARVPESSGPLLALAVLMVGLSILSDSFLTLTNLLNVAQQVAVLAVLALGATAVIITGGIDLSVGSVLGLAGAVVGWLHIGHDVPIVVAAAAALLVGLAAGIVNGLLITVGRLPAFIATLAMLSVARGLALVILDGRPLSGYPEGFRDIAVYYFGGRLPSSVVVVVVLAVLGMLYLRYRPGGRALYAIGASEEVSRLSGLPVQRTKIAVYAMAGLLAGVGGLLVTARLDSAQPTAGSGIELDVIAAVVIGGASLAGGVGSLFGTLVGVLIIGVLRNGLNLLDVSSFWQQVVIGAVIAVAVLAENLRHRRSR